MSVNVTCIVSCVLFKLNDTFHVIEAVLHSLAIDRQVPLAQLHIKTVTVEMKWES